MQHNTRKAADYTIEREFLGDITVAELIEQIIQSHLFPPSGYAAALSKTEHASQIRKPNEDRSF